MCTHTNTCDIYVACSGLQLLPPHGPPRIYLSDICPTTGFWGGCPPPPPARRTLNQLARYPSLPISPFLAGFFLPRNPTGDRQLSMFARHTGQECKGTLASTGNRGLGGIPPAHALSWVGVYGRRACSDPSELPPCPTQDLGTLWCLDVLSLPGTVSA